MSEPSRQRRPAAAEDYEDLLGSSLPSLPCLALSISPHFPWPTVFNPQRPTYKQHPTHGSILLHTQTCCIHLPMYTKHTFSMKDESLSPKNTFKETLWKYLYDAHYFPVFPHVSFMAVVVWANLIFSSVCIAAPTPSLGSNYFYLDTLSDKLNHFLYTYMC